VNKAASSAIDDVGVSAEITWSQAETKARRGSFTGVTAKLGEGIIANRARVVAEVLEARSNTAQMKFNY
jgi:hypothetical protein